MSTDQLIAKKYPIRAISSNSTQPQYLDPIVVGPLFVNPGTIICDQCGKMIRANYLTAHRNSGACLRNQQRIDDDKD